MAYVLLIDDEADILTILKRSLETSGIKSYGFTNPVLAMENFRRNPDSYGLVISDIHMPRLNGFEVARTIKGINPDVRLALMTAFDVHKSEVEKVLPTLKVDALITKPVRPAAFVQLVKEIMSR